MVYSYVFCVVSAVRNFSLGLLQAKAKRQANGDQWKQGHAG
jgi:hypothetical protein